MFRFRIAEPGTDDLETWHRLRTHLYLEASLISPEDVDPASGLFTDQYDDYSTHLLATDDDGVDIGCCRMIDGGLDRTLPVTDLFGVERLPHSYESSGTAVAPTHRRTLVSLGLYRAMSALADERGYEYGYAIVEPPYLASLQGLGYPYEAISEPRHVFGFPNVAAVFRRRDLLPSMAAADGPFASVVLRYYQRPFDWTLTENDVTLPVR